MADETSLEWSKRRHRIWIEEVKIPRNPDRRLRISNTWPAVWFASLWNSTKFGWNTWNTSTRGAEHLTFWEYRFFCMGYPISYLACAWHVVVARSRHRARVTVTKFELILVEGKLRCLPDNLPSSIRKHVRNTLEKMSRKSQVKNRRWCRARLIATWNFLMEKFSFFLVWF